LDTKPGPFWIWVALIFAAGGAVTIGALWLIFIEPVPQ
jgi:hypothetical protein